MCSSGTASAPCSCSKAPPRTAQLVACQDKHMKGLGSLNRVPLLPGAVISEEDSRLGAAGTGHRLLE